MAFPTCSWSSPGYTPRVEHPYPSARRSRLTTLCRVATPNSDIVPIQLSLTSGDLLTLWAPRWRENGEEWEAFLGDEEALFAFPDAPALAAFVRTASAHDLSDHPSWSIVRELSVSELMPDDTHCYDIVGVFELAADEPDSWAIGELVEVTRMARSLADTCGLGVVHEVLDSTPGFALLEQGSWAFSGREGAKNWKQLADTVVQRWDEVIDALDSVVKTPEVDQRALADARRELTDEAPRSADKEADETGGSPDNFWEEVGIDPILITTSQGDHYTLRCYINDRPVFLGSGGQIDVFPSAHALARYLAGAGAAGHDMTSASTWTDVTAAANSGELRIEVDPQNTYRLTGLGEDLAEGPIAVDANQLDLAVELLLDVGDWSGDDSAARALASSQSLGWLTSFILRPDPTRLAPSPPFDTEVSAWNALVDGIVARLRQP